MKASSYQKTIKNLWQRHNEEFTFILLMIIFTAYASYIALNLEVGIIPDEITHFDFSKQFATTFGIPPELPDAYNYGVYITQSPYLYYWINGRIINIATLFSPSSSDWQLLTTLRLVSVLFSLGTVIFSYLFSKEFIKHKWWQLLPSFFLTNTLMFVFLAGGVNYDNLTNLFCFAGLYFLARVFNNRSFFINSLAWMICIALGSLTKYTVLPLALAMGIAWIVFFIRNRKNILPIRINKGTDLVLLLILLLLLLGNLSIYGYNLFTYNALLPECEDIFIEELCRFDLFNLRMEKYGVGGKLTIPESIKFGHPNPVEYFFQWIITIINNIFGIGSHKIYKTLERFILHSFLLLWIFAIVIINKTYLKTKYLYFIIIFLFYSLTLFFYNYSHELTSGFANFAIHGRYLFPVIGILFTAMGKGIMKITDERIRKITLIFAILLYFFTGPLTFIYRYNTVFVDWFVR